MIIETERLMLRPFTMDDFDIIYRLYSDEEILRYMPNDIMDEEQAGKHLERIVSDWDEVPLVSCEMAVILRETQQKIGRTRFHMDEETDTAMLGWLLLQPYWGQHLATEMTRAMIDYAFDTIGVHRVSALCNPDNIASWKAMENCGMRREAHYRKKVRYVRHGVPSWEDELEYAILREERQ